MKLVYVAHPLGGGADRESNRQRAARWCRWVADQGHAPVADWIILSGLWEEAPENRAKGLAIDTAIVAWCDELWLVGGRISPGMQIEADAARAAGVPVFDLTHLGAEPPCASVKSEVACHPPDPGRDQE